MVLNVLATDRAVDSIVDLINEDGAAQNFVVQAPGGTGTITPLSNVAWVDANSAAVGTPDGSIANPFLDVQDAINAGFNVAMVCPGNYGTILLVALTGQPFTLIGLGSLDQAGSGRVAVGNVNNITSTTVTLENCTAGQVDLSNAGISTLNLIDVSLSGNIIGDGLGNSTLRFGTRLQDVGDGQQPNQFAGTLAMGELRGSYANFAGDLVCVNVAFDYVHGVGISSTGECELLNNCRFDGDLSFSAGGDHVVRASTVVGPLFMAGGGTQRVYDSFLNSSVDTGIGDGALEFHNTRLQTGPAVQCSADAATEAVSYRAGGVFPDGTQIRSLDSAFGDFVPASATATVNVSGPTRVVLNPDLPAAQHVRLQNTGATDLQTFWIDSWASQTCEVQDNAGGHIFTIPANSAGQGFRYKFSFSSGTTDFTGPTDFWRLAGP